MLINTYLFLWAFKKIKNSGEKKLGRGINNIYLFDNNYLLIGTTAIWKQKVIKSFENVRIRLLHRERGRT